MNEAMNRKKKLITEEITRPSIGLPLNRARNTPCGYITWAMCWRTASKNTWKRKILMPHDVEPAQPPTNMMIKKKATACGPQRP
jgi:hypothetical protein